MLTCGRTKKRRSPGDEPYMPVPVSGDGLDPAAPVLLPLVAGPSPQRLPELVVVKDHGVQPRGPQLLQAGGPGVEQRPANAPTARFRVHGEPVQVRSPPVP